MQTTPQVQAQPSTASDRLFVTKIPSIVGKDQLKDHFGQFGELTDVYLPAVPGSSNHKGIAFVSFGDPLALQLALQHSPHEIWGNTVVVDVAAPRGATSRPFQPRPDQVQFAIACEPQQVHDHQVVGYQPPQQLVPAGPSPGVAAFAEPVSSTITLYSPQDGVSATAGFPVALAAPGRAGTPVPGRLFVTRVTPDMSKGDLQNYFEQFGELLDVFVPNAKGIAFVSFKDAAVAAGVLQAQTHFVKEGKAVLVDQALERPSLGDKGAGRSGGAYLGPPSKLVAAGADAAWGAAPASWEAYAAPQQIRFAPY